MQAPRLSRKDFARKLRREASKAEVILWERLRNRQMEGFKFVRQEPLGPYIADFLCRSERLVVEIDGETHGTAEELARDNDRTAWLGANGYRVIRFSNVDVYEALDGVIGEIIRALRVR